MLDCHGDVVTACPPDQGCSGTGCVPACDSAKDNRTSVGCDYYSVEPDVVSSGSGACFAAFIANTWTTPVDVMVDYDGTQYDVATFGYLSSGSGPSITYTPLGGQIPAGQVAVLFLSRRPGVSAGLDLDCPPGVTPMITTDGATHGTAMGHAFHITASAPVVAYDMYPFGGGKSALSSATLLLPASAWDTNYVAADPGPSVFGQGSAFVEIVGHSNFTQVTVNPVAAVTGGVGVPATPAGTPHTYSLDNGEVLQLTQSGELAGSVIQASAPVGVWGGHTGLQLEACCSDSAHQQIPPVRALGSTYVAVRYRNRYDGIEESPPWRLIGTVDGTALAYDPAPPAGAPLTLDRGQVVQFDAPGPFVVSSQDASHPFYMSAQMTGGGLYDPDPSGNSDGRGDAEFVNVVPPAQYLSRYLFFTDPTFPETDLVIVRTLGAGGFADVDLDCAGVLTGWQPVGSAGTYEYTRFDLSRHDFQGQNGCDNGRHTISSAAPFAVTVWGWGSAETGTAASGVYSQYVSYAYPAGAGVAAINNVVVDAAP